MERHEFVARHPRLWHLAHADAWPTIQEHGLLSAARLVALADLPPDRADTLLSRRRAASEALDLPDGSQAVLRDQKPLHEGKLASVLTDGMTVSDWLRLLNSLVFFFPTDEALRAVYAAYAADPVVVLTVDTDGLLDDYGSLVRLAHINTGSTLYAPAKRGSSTFLPVERFDRRKTVKEVAVRDAVPNITDHLFGVETWLPDGTVLPVATRAAAD